MTEKESWERCLKLVDQGRGNTFLCVEVARLDADHDIKDAMLSKIRNALRAMQRKARYMQTHIMTPRCAGEIEMRDHAKYGKLLRSAFCRRMIHECE